MSKKVADVLWEMLAKAGVKRCYGIVGDALNPVVDALRRNGAIEFVSVRHEEYGVFAAVAEAYFTGNPVVVCGTAGPGVVHLFNGLMDARKEGAPIIAIAGDVESSIIDTSALEELNPYKFFEAASLYTARLVNPEQARAVINTAILTAVLEKGPTVLSIPGDVASADAPDQPTAFTIAAPAILRPSDTDFEKLVRMIEKFDFVHIEQQEAGIIPFGVEFKNPNFAKVAEAMGAKGIRIEEPENVREGLAEALAYKDGPVVVDAVVDPLALAMPSHSPFHTVKGFTLSFAKQVLSGRLDTVIKEIERNVGIV